MNLFNLSKTEFIAFLDCRLKFYLLKQQNQGTEVGPPRQSFKHYQSNLRTGLMWHRRLHAFLNDYKAALSGNEPPPAIIEDEIVYRLFWEHEKHRFLVDPEHWFPLALEFYLHTSSMRGVIDRVDPIDDHSCCIIEYKPSPSSSGYLHEELLFYALLATTSKTFKQRFNRTVTQVGCYYYFTGEFITMPVTSEILMEFSEFFSSIQEDIAKGTYFPRLNCSLLASECDYAVLCTKIPDNLKRSI